MPKKDSGVCATCSAAFTPRSSTDHNCMTCAQEKKSAQLAEATEKRRIARLKKSERKKDASRRRAAKKQRDQREKTRAAAEFKKQRAAEIAAKQKVEKVNVIQRELAARTLAKKKLIALILRNKPDYLPGWVHKDICVRLEKFLKDAADGKSPRLMLQMPPRHGKSEIASVNFPAFILGNYPQFEIIAASYASSLALEFSRKVRAICESDSYKSVFGETRVDQENRNAEGWKTTKGGGYTPAGVGGPITGKGAHIFIIDDPVKNAAEADSETDRESKKNWYQTTAYTRLAPGGGMLVIQTRWHEDDLSGWLEEQMDQGEGDDFEIIRYPMVAEADEKYRRKGEALHPARYPTEAAERIKKAVGPRTWGALYQQNPVGDGGQYFNREMFTWYTGPAPPRLATYAAFDLAIGKGERNDWTVGVIVGVDTHDDIWVLDVIRGRWDSHEIVEQILWTQREYSPETIGLEKGQIQMSIMPYLEKRIAEERMYALNPLPLPTGRRDKQARARAIQGRMKQGKVRFPKDAPWLDEMMREMLAFPDGKHDDIVDAIAWIGLMLQDMVTPASQQIVSKYEKGWRKDLSKFIGMSTGGKRNAMTA